MNNLCSFCRIATGESPARLVYQDPEIIAFHDISPVAPTHVLIIPRKHILSVADASPADGSLLGRMVLVAAQIARESNLASFRLVTNSGRQAGQSAFHLHIHLLGGRTMSWPPG